MNLKISSFFHYYMFHPLSSELSKRERLEAFIASFALAILFGGLCHLACAVLFRNYTHIPPGTKTPATKTFQKVMGPDPYKDSQLATGEEIHHFRTKGGGSCAFHALFGSWNGEMYEYKGVEVLRNEFVEYLKERASKNILPPEIPNAFTLYLEGKEREDLQKAFQGYLEELRNPENYLLQDVLIALADWQGISVELVQRGWGIDADKIQSSIPNPGHARQVTVYYARIDDTRGHYERAEVVRSSHVDQ